ncbi:MAG: ABC transporter permease [Candidatus Omnitrophica bacterium]|nr:ABC transporter permease [Candidatus Omnitrophota bacterium]
MDEINHKTTIYEPNKYLKRGIKIWKDMFLELMESRELVWRLFVRNLSAKYRQSILGYVWFLLMPFIAIGTFMYLNRVGIVNIDTVDIPYPLFALIGLTIWQLFSTGIVSGTNSIVSAGSMVVKINFPRESLVFSSMAQGLFEFMVKSVLIVIFFFIFKVVPSPWGLLFPVAVLPIIILTVGLSLILSLVNGVLRDTANAVSLLTTFLMFLTPVLYPISATKSIYLKLNPLIPLVNTPRDLLVYGSIKEPVEFCVATIISVVVLLCAWRIFHLVETKIPERL